MAGTNPFADIVPGAGVPSASGNPFSDIVAGQADVVPAAGGEPARITVRPQGFVENATAPITNIPGTYADIVRNAVGNMLAGPKQAAGGLASYGAEDQGLEAAIRNIQGGQDIDLAVSRATQEAPPKPQGSITDRLNAVGNILGGIARTAGGAAEYTSAPIIAPFRSIVSQPVENVTGLPKEYTETAAMAFAPIPKAIPGFARAPEGFVPPRPTAPTNAELRTTARSQYQSPEVTGFMAQPSAATRLSQEIRADLAKGAFSDIDATKTFQYLDRFDEMPPNAVGFSAANLETLRKQLGRIKPIRDQQGQITNAADLEAANVARRRIDGFLGTVTPEEVISGNPAAAAATLAKARGNVSARKSSEAFSAKEFKAELRQMRTGKPASETMRQRIENILANPSERRSYSGEELGLMQRILQGGGRLERGLRATAEPLGGIVPSVVAGVAGHAAAGPFGALAAVAPRLVSAGIKGLANKITAKELTRLGEAIRSDSPLGRQLITPMEDFGRAHEAFQAAPTAQNLARLTLASRNLSNNLLDAGIKVAPDRLIRFEGVVGAGAEQDQQ